MAYMHPNGVLTAEVNAAHVTEFNNVTNVRNTTVNNITVNNFANRSAATVVPANVMTASRPVQSAVQRISPQQLAAAQPISGPMPVRPISTTSGVTPAVARQLDLAPAAPGSVRAAPGPVVRPAVAAGPAARPAASKRCRRWSPPIRASRGHLTRRRQPGAAASANGAPHLPGPARGTWRGDAGCEPRAAAAVTAPHLPGQPGPPGAATPDANHNAAAVSAPHLPGQPAATWRGDAGCEPQRGRRRGIPHLPGQPGPPGAATPDANHNAAAVAAPHLPGQPGPPGRGDAGCEPQCAAVAAPHLPGQPGHLARRRRMRPQRGRRRGTASAGSTGQATWRGDAGCEPERRGRHATCDCSGPRPAAARRTGDGFAATYGTAGCSPDSHRAGTAGSRGTAAAGPGLPPASAANARRTAATTPAARCPRRQRRKCTPHRSHNPSRRLSTHRRRKCMPRRSRNPSRRLSTRRRRRCMLRRRHSRRLSAHRLQRCMPRQRRILRPRRHRTQRSSSTRSGRPAVSAGTAQAGLVSR